MSTVRINPQTGIPEVMPDTRSPRIQQPRGLGSMGQATQQPMVVPSMGGQPIPRALSTNTTMASDITGMMQQPMNIMGQPMQQPQPYKTPSLNDQPQANPQRRLRDLLESGVFGGGKITPRTGIRGDGRSANDLQRMLNRQTVAKDEVAGVKADIQSLERDRAINRMARQMANNQPQRPTAPVQAPPERDLPRPPNPFLDRIRQADVQPQLGMGIGAASPDGMEPRGQLPFSGGLGPNINNMGSPNGIMGGFNPMQQPQQFAGGYGQQPQQTPYQQYGLSGGGYQQNPYQAAQPQPQQYGGYGPNQSYGGYGGLQGVPNPYAPQQVGQMASQIAQPMY
tara:strand:- start:955 stop:1968 length:1014 start_codon:yes stop_codon:yes gene_type:complete